MIQSNLKIFLASKSPRRKKLLEQINLRPELLLCHFDEKFEAAQRPSLIAKKLAMQKLDEAKKLQKKGIVITADTLVVVDKKILGKPTSDRQAVAMLKNLSGKKHFVYTGFCVYNSLNGVLINDYEKTEVTFRKLSEKEIEEYVAGGSPMDKAGAYGIQDDYGAIFIEKINGCYNNVVGLPLTKVYMAIMKVL
ncbi:MAG: septum formation protein Maf [Ignavibacteria bacterium CG22_combo_CG10-13_8_21_14_all_37_15]|nr:septum formation protein Maf [Ignavibacteria bacterium]PIP76705.1 MAG: septum formation protein Maf [Ignavibacteria bacterium CG22_combo_CG10-13_8_21_14_all_37_15]PIS43843.1 MAG: septum formation protein Maf [Ignavibacteria bacterium CG08_land_8_20_14_0_20_37_9]PIX94625.1 MAG: septum formation protein Maf [Ignavibacteria bacterium CG_4_10_14_3_um_filter_37_18]PJC58944.1 MAG: septum formation protein Maf [Ignavibacteria bacterium CG_4_9_14_0_2_um_filter_37_13]